MKKLIHFIFCRFLFHVEYQGLENLNQYDRCLICPNHSTIFDPLWIYPVSSNLAIMAKEEIFHYPILKHFLKHYGVFPVYRKKRDPQSLFSALSIFEDNKPRQLLLFPEGGVVKNKEDIGKKAKNGATYISAKIQIPIVPTYLTRRPKFFSKVTVTFGKPIFIPSCVISDKAELKSKSQELISLIYRLKN